MNLFVPIAIAAVLMLWASTIWISWLNRRYFCDDCEKEESASPDHAKCAYHSGDISDPAFSNPQEIQRNASEAYQRWHERRYWRATSYINGFAMLGAIAAAIAAGYAFQEARRQADAAFQSNRAWLDIDHGQAFWRWINPDGPTLTTVIQAKNVGHSPALKGSIFPVINIAPAFVSPWVNPENTKAACSTHGGGGPGIYGNTIFMAEEIGTASTIGFAWKQVDNYYKFMIKEGRMSRTEEQAMRKWLPTSLIICARYKIVGDEVEHHTGRVFDVGVQQRTPQGFRHVFMPAGKDFLDGTVDLQRDYNGDYTD